MRIAHLIPILMATTILVCCESSPSTFDGTYVGNIQLQPNSASNCYKAPSAQMVVVDGKLEYRYFGVVSIFKTVVRDDGSFSGSALNRVTQAIVRLNGRVSSDSIEADTESPACRNHLTLTKVAPHPADSTVGVAP
jgi:hypothetical protein